MGIYDSLPDPASIFDSSPDFSSFLSGDSGGYPSASTVENITGFGPNQGQNDLGLNTGSWHAGETLGDAFSGNEVAAGIDVVKYTPEYLTDLWNNGSKAAGQIGNFFGNLF